MNDVMQRIEDRLIEIGRKKIDLCKATGIGTGTYSTWKNKDRIPGGEYLPAIAEFLGVSVDYILTGKEPASPIAAYEVNKDTLEKYILEQETVTIKVLGRVAAGVPIDAVEDIIGEETISKKMSESGEYFGLRINGDSMEPRMFSGDIVIVRQQNDVENGDIAIVLVNGGEATCKKIEKHSNGIMLVPLNKQYQPKFYSNDDIENLPVRILGKVVEIRVKL